jgi:pimeloyl-ACP methyl ester carboxylesterase
MKTSSFSTMKHIFIVCLLGLGCLIYCATPVKSTEATYQKGGGKLITTEGYQFSYEFYPVEKKGPSVIFITGLGGRMSGLYALASLLNKANFNFIEFDRAGMASTAQRESIAIITKRSKSGDIMWPSVDGKEPGAENIVRNEISAVIEFVENAPTHDPKQGIYLIGGSYGSWLSLVTVHSFPEKIKGVVFLSPAILPKWVSPGAETHNQKLNIIKYFQTLIRNFGQRPALAIGSKTDTIIHDKPQDGSALDGVLLLKKEIGANVEVMEVSTSLHAQALVKGSQEVREKIVQWLSEQVAKK